MEEKKPHSFLNTLTTLVLLGICVFLAYLIGKSVLEKAPQSQRSQQNAPSTTASVIAYTVEPGDFVRTSSFGAEIEGSMDSHKLYSTDVSGTITALYLEKGQSIKAGDTIAIIDPSSAGEIYKPSEVKASIGGTIYSVDSYVGEKVSTSTALATVGDSGDLQVVAKVSERYLSTLKVGMSATFTTSAWPDEPFKATVSSISPTVDTTSRTVEVTLKIDEKDARLKEGMYVSLTLTVEEQDDVLMVPTTAIGSYLGEPVLFVVQDGKAKRVSVTPGSANDTSTIIESGLQAGDQVITAGSVTDGVAVSVVQQ